MYEPANSWSAGLWMSLFDSTIEIASPYVGLLNLPLEDGTASVYIAWVLKGCAWSSLHIVRYNIIII